MLQQVKQIEEFFRNEVNEDRSTRGNRLPAPLYDMKESPNESHSSKEVEMLKKEISSLRRDLEGTKSSGVIHIYTPLHISIHISILYYIYISPYCPIIGPSQSEFSEELS